MRRRRVAILGGTGLLLTLAMVVIGAGRPSRAQEVNPRAFARDPVEIEAATDADRQAQPTPPPSRPVYVFQAGPIDLPSLIKRLDSPDMVLLNGAEYARLRGWTGTGADVAADPSRPPASSITSIDLTGVVNQGSAVLKATIEVAPVGDSENAGAGLSWWVPIRMESATIVSVRDQLGRDRPLRECAPPGVGWEAEVAGGVPSRLTIELVVAVKSSAETDQFDLALPASSRTRLDLALPGRVVEADLGAGRPLRPEPREDGAGTRVRASLPARDLLVVRWRAASAAGDGPPVLTAQGEIALEVGRGLLTSRSNWSILCERGVARELELTGLDPADEIVSVLVDDQPVASPRPPPGAANPTSLKLPLSTPLPVGGKARVTISTRRSLPTAAMSRTIIRGFPFQNAASQTGMLAIVEGPDQWITGSAGNGLRPIDPRDLDDTLRARPSTVLAYIVLEQPFSLDLRIDPAPASFLVETRSNIGLEPGLARTATTVTLQTVRGGAREQTLSLPPGVEVERVGPASVVSSHQVLAREPGSKDRLVVVRLAVPDPTGPGLSYEVLTRQSLAEVDGEGRVAIGLPGPVEGVDLGGTLTVTSATPGQAAALDGDPAAMGLVTMVRAPVATGGPRPMLAYNFVRRPLLLPLEIARRARTIEHEVELSYRVGPKTIDLDQTIVSRVRDSVIDAIELEVPEALVGGWQVASIEARPVTARVVSSEPVLAGGPGGAGTGSRRVRLGLEPPVTSKLILRLTGRMGPVANNNANGETPAGPTTLAGLRPLDGTIERTRMRVEPTDGQPIGLDGEGWMLAGTDQAAPTSSSSKSASSSHLIVETVTKEEPGWPSSWPVLTLAPATVAGMPPRYVSTLWTRAIMAADGAARCRVRMKVEQHDGVFEFALPSSARQVLVRFDRAPATVVSLAGEAGADATTSYRVAMPATRGGAEEMELSYVASGALNRGGLALPRLPDSVVVARSLVEVLLPGSRALVGSPAGWVDANRWAWAGYVWKRSPSLSTEELTAMTSVRPTGAAAAVAGEPDAIDRSDFHGYLFVRDGTPGPFEARVWPRWALVGLGSGSVLLVGILGLLLRPSRGFVVVGLLVGAFGLGLMIDPDTLLQVGQSSVLGLALTLLAAAVQTMVERPPSSVRRMPAGSSTITRGGASSSSPPRGLPLEEPEDNESTVLRRPQSASSVERDAPDWVPTRVQPGGGPGPTEGGPGGSSPPRSAPFSDPPGPEKPSSHSSTVAKPSSPRGTSP